MGSARLQNLMSKNHQQLPGEGALPSDGAEFLPASSSPAPLSRRLTAKKKDQRLKRAVGALRRAAPWLKSSDTVVLRNFARLEFLAAAAHERVRKDGAFDEFGFPTPSAEYLRRLTLAVTRVGADLGLTPRSRVELNNGGVKTILIETEQKEDMAGRAQVMAEAVRLLAASGITVRLPKPEQQAIETSATTEVDDG
jgi:hypothetical protein